MQAHNSKQNKKPHQMQIFNIWFAKTLSLKITKKEQPVFKPQN